MPTLQKRFETLDSLRGICAIMVVCFHVRILLSFTEYTLFRNSSYFVEFFFVLSGFVMFHTYGKSQFTRPKLATYLKKRFFRLYPMHILTLGLIILIEFIKLYAGKKGIVFSTLAFSDATAPSELVPNILLLQAWLPNTDSYSFNIVSWSISIEFYMYIILGIFLFAGERIRIFSFLIIVLVTLYLIVIHSSLIKQEVLRGLSCFFGGCLCYTIYEKTSLEERPISKLLFTFLEILSIILIIIALTQTIGYKGVVISFTFCFSVLVFAPGKGAISTIFKLSPFAYLGKLSYSIYILHFIIWFFLIAFALVVTRITGRQFTVQDHLNHNTRLVTTNNQLIDQLLLVCILSIVVILSGFTYRFIEKKGIEWGNKLTKTTKD